MGHGCMCTGGIFSDCITQPMLLVQYYSTMSDCLSMPSMQMKLVYRLEKDNIPHQIVNCLFQ